MDCRRALTVCGIGVLGVLCPLMQPAQGDDDATLQKRRVTDRWQMIGADNTQALVWSLDRKNPLLLHCEKGSGLDLVIAPEKSSPGEKGHYPVTITFDHNTTITQTWLVGSKGAWATMDANPDFANLLAMLKTHQEAEFVLRRPSKDPIDAHFLLNGAKAAINAVVGECSKQ